MEMVSEARERPAYYFSWPDQEILEDHVLALSCDEDTWLYKIETTKINGQFEHYQLGSSIKDNLSPSYSGSVDTRTFTRRKHNSLRPSLESVVESPLSNNRSSLGLLSSSKLLNDNLSFLPDQTPVSQEKTFSSSIVFDKNNFSQRTFKLDCPVTSSSILGADRFSSQSGNFERIRGDSESSDVSTPHSLGNFSSFEKNGLMTDSLVRFLEKQEVSCNPPTEFQDERKMSNSILSLSESCDITNGVHGNSNSMTDSMINYLMPVNCKPPLGFEDNSLATSYINIDEEDNLPVYEMTNSLMNYLDDVKSKSPVPSSQSKTSYETENIPPNNSETQGPLPVSYSDNLEVVKASGDRMRKIDSLNTTNEFQKGENVIYTSRPKEHNEMANITFTNNVNISKKRKDKEGIQEDLDITRTLKTNFEKEFDDVKDYSERSFKLKALNNRDLNVTRDLNHEESHNVNLMKPQPKESLNSSLSTNRTRRNETFTKSDIDGALSVSRHIPSRNSTFNTTYTKLQSQSEQRNDSLQKHFKDARGLNSVYAKSIEMLNGGLEDDQTSSASDSSFSSGSTKPRSVDELRTIAQQQESSLVQQTSTPESSAINSCLATNLDIELSPIRRPSIGGGRNNSESRSANCSPVRNQQPYLQYHHPVSRLQQPSSVESRRLTLQASSLSNIARPRASGMRLPQALNRFSFQQRMVTRPSTAPAPVQPVTAIPRPQSSRLPMPRFRGSSIPALKRGGAH